MLQRTQPSVKFLSLGLAESRILFAAPVNTHPRTPLISFCTVQLRTLCAAHSLATLCLSTTSGSDPGELPGFWGSMVFRHAPIPRKGSGKQHTITNTINGPPTHSSTFAGCLNSRCSPVFCLLISNIKVFCKYLA